jgi:6,7-dimethyl-8-ribityllumazine synthase
MSKILLIDEKNASVTFPVAVVVSRFNEEITGPLLEGALSRLKERGFDEGQITVVWVPGAVEIPLVAQKLAQLGKYDAILALGAVIRGDTDHYDYVCEQVSQGCQHVALQNDLPVLFGVLTTNTEAQAKERAGGAHGNKGRDSVDAAVETVSVLRRFR